jgi:hypothetical protein
MIKLLLGLVGTKGSDINVGNSKNSNDGLPNVDCKLKRVLSLADKVIIFMI